MDILVRDLRLAFRRLRRNPGFTAVALTTLALGIGANVAMFSLLNGVVLRPLPYRNPDRLVAVWPAQNFNKALAERFEDAGTLDGVAGLSHWSMAMVGDGEAEQVQVGVVGVDFFDVLGVRPALGRTFLPEEVDPSRSDVVVLTHGLWQRRYGGDPDIVGRVIPLDGYGAGSTRRVVGVLPEGWRAPVREAEAWIPLDQPPGRTVANDSSWYVNWVVGRLAPGATVESASAEVRAMASRLKAEHPGLFEDATVAAATVIPLRESVVGATGRMLWLLLGAVGLVLLIACVNVANLLLARAGSQETELAVRKALGASRARVIRQGVTESVLLAVLGGAAGVLLAAWLLGALGPELESRLPRAGELSLNGPVLGFTLVVTLVAAALSGLLPAFRSASREASGGLRSGTRSGAGRGRHRLNRALVTAEIALAVVLVSAAGLVANSFWRLYTTDTGFDAEGVLAVEVAPPPSRYESPDAQRTYYRQLLDAVRAVPGVAAAEAIHLLPLTTSNWAFPYLAEDYEARGDRPLPAANFRVVTPGYFEVMGMKLLRGRWLTEADGPTAEPVGLINRRLAEERWPGEDPVGKEIRIFGDRPFRVVGVVEDVRQHALDQPPRPELYRPHAQWPLASMFVMVRARRADGATALADPVRRAIWDIDASVPIPTIRPLDQVRGDSAARARLLAGLLGAFGALALILGAVGVYGVMAYTTGMRRREFGVRLALGATPAAIQRQALRWGMAPVAAGLIVGAAGTLAAGRLLAGILFGVEADDPATLVVVAALLGAVATLATWIPARRVGRVRPVQVLKQE